LRGTKTHPFRAAIFLVVTPIFFLEGNKARAQGPPAPDAAAAQPAWHVIVSYGQASAPRSQGFAEAATLSVARDVPLGSGFSWGIELTPLFVVNQTRVDLPGRPRNIAFAVAAGPLVRWTYLPRTARVGLLIEAGVSLFSGFSPIPAEGSRFNFLDQFGGLILVRIGQDYIVSAGVRRVHVSNLGFAGPDNPGLSFYSGVVGISWPTR
jgi:hypothetical protein